MRRIIPIIVLVVILAGGSALCLAGSITYLILKGIDESEAAEASRDFLSSSPELLAGIGNPRSFGWTLGNINLSNGCGRADINIYVEGERGSGRAYLLLTSAPGGPWRVISASFVRSDGTTISLSTGSGTGAAL